MLSRLEDVGRWGQRWARASEPWTNVVGVARSLMAASTALTLAVNPTTTFFRPVAGLQSSPYCPIDQTLFCVLSGHLQLARWLAVAALVIVASGYRPRYTGLLHWWITLSFNLNAAMIEGGDGAAAILTFLLIPITLTDSRKWHWDAPLQPKMTLGDDLARLVAMVSLIVIRVQVAGIYMHAAIGKFEVEEWANGTALYYWALSPIFGAYGFVATVLRPVVVNAFGVTVLTWSVLAIEYFLSAALLMPKRLWRVFLVLGIALHAGIILVHGLVTFSMVMFAALVLYLRPVENVFVFRRGKAAARASAPAPAARLAPGLERA